MQCINQNVGYNQPTNVGYYIGSDQTDAEIWAAAKKVEEDRQKAIVTDIRTLPADVQRQTDDAWYNMKGQKITQPQRGGIYIHQGKKVIR